MIDFILRQAYSLRHICIPFTSIIHYCSPQIHSNPLAIGAAKVVDNFKCRSIVLFTGCRLKIFKL